MITSKTHEHIVSRFDRTAIYSSMRNASSQFSFSLLVKIIKQPQKNKCQNCNQSWKN